MISGNVNSWARHLTSNPNLKSVRETYDLSAAMAQNWRKIKLEKRRDELKRRKLKKQKNWETKKQKEEEREIEKSNGCCN